MSASRFISFMMIAACLFCCTGFSLQAQQNADRTSVVEQIQAGEHAMQQGNLAVAESSFRRAVETASDLSDAHLGLGLVELREGKLEDATRELKRATELNSQLPGAHMFLGIAEYQMGQGGAAAEALKAEVVLQPQSVEALTWLGMVELGLGHPEDATGPLDQAALLAPKDQNVLFYKAHAHSLVAENAYQRMYKLDPDSVLVHRALGDTLARSGQPEKAIVEYEAAIKKQPGNADLYELLAEQDQKISRDDAAMAAYQQELKLNPHSAIALYNVGMMQVKHGEMAEGVRTLQKARQEHSAEAPTDFYMGLGLAELGRNEEAAHWLEQALASGPSEFIEQGANYKLVRVYQQLHREADMQRALDRLKELKQNEAKTRSGGGDALGAASVVEAPAR